MKKFACVLACVFAVFFAAMISFAGTSEAGGDNLHGFALTWGGNNNLYVLPGEQLSFECIPTSGEKEGFKEIAALSAEVLSSYLSSSNDFSIAWNIGWTGSGWKGVTANTAGEKFSASSKSSQDDSEAIDTGIIFLKKKIKNQTEDSGNWVREEILYTFLSYSNTSNGFFTNMPFPNLFSFSTSPNGIKSVELGSNLFLVFHIKVIDEEEKQHDYYLDKVIWNIDGVRGDVNGDSRVDEKDLEELSFRNGDFFSDEEGHYTAAGLNYGRGMVLFSIPDLLSTWLIGVWIYNPNNPIAQGLGIGGLMSKSPYSNNGVAKPAGPTIVRNMPYNYKIVDDVMTITTQGHAVNITAVLPDGKLWQETKWVENGEIKINIPDPELKYNIESTWIPGKNQTDFQTSIASDLPTAFVTLANYPNPFNPSTTIEFVLPESENIAVEVYNISGQKVATLANGFMNAGRHSIVWNAKNLSAGIYFCILKTEGKVLLTQKMTLLK